MRFLNRLTALFLLLACTTTLAFPFSASAKTTPPPHYVRLWYYNGSATGKAAFFAHPSLVDIFAPQSYALDSSGNLGGSLDASLLAFAKKHSIEVMPLVTNGVFSATSSTAILTNSQIQATAIAALIAEAKKNGYWGWQIDFEQMDASYRDAFSNFVANAYQAFHTNGLKLSVAVMAQTSENPSDYPNNLWQKIIGVYNYSAIGAHSDFVSIMSYDDPNSSGPVTEYPWLVNVLLYSMSQIPATKVSLGIPLYYWQWDDTTGKRVGIGGNTGLQNVLKKYKTAYTYSTKQEAPFIHYYATGEGYTIWYENQSSVAKKIDLIKNNHLYGFSAWALGQEVPSVYKVVKE